MSRIIIWNNSEINLNNEVKGQKDKMIIRESKKREDKSANLIANAIRIRRANRIIRYISVIVRITKQSKFMGHSQKYVIKYINLQINSERISIFEASDRSEDCKIVGVH
jgi:hypothetical protein